MAENKKSVLLYCDIIHTVDKLDNETAGKLFKHYLKYINDLNPKTDNLLVEIAFEPIKQTLKRDLKKWEKRAEISRNNGAKGGRPKTQKTQRVISKPRKPVSVNVSVKDKDNVNVSVKDKVIKEKQNLFTKDIYDCYNQILNYFPEHLHPKKEESWLKTIKDLNEIDKIPFHKILEIVKKTRADNFWSKNFLTLTKLRKKNRDGIKYIVYFNEQIKAKFNPAEELMRQLIR